jgi:cytochrome c oxidase cbb3-type subunit III
MKTQPAYRLYMAIFLIALLPSVVFGAEKTSAPGTYFSNPLFNTLLAIIIVLLIMVIALSRALKNLISSDMILEKFKKEKEAQSNSSKITLLFVFFSVLSFSALAQDKAMVIAKDDTIGGLDLGTFYTMTVVIGLELITLGILFSIFKTLLVSEKKAAAVKEAKPKTKTILDKLNDTVEIEKEESIMLDHDYDGIKELDNNLPPWWKYGFYLTILIAMIYMINYHVTKTSPLQAEEYKISLKKAEAEVAAYMATAANSVDENSVKPLSDPSELAAGKDIFISVCSACHGREGQGGVGPNLTDDYWLAGGSVKDIFKTIKYGRPDKGMKSWKDDYSPMQIAQLTSFIRTLKGSKPAGAKEKQGDLYIEKENPSDSTNTKQDTIKPLAQIK